MESPRALSNPPSALSQQLGRVAVRKHGVRTSQVPRIGEDPDLFDAFYDEHLENLQRFVARRVGDPDRAADLTADIFLAAIDSAHTYQPRSTPKAWLYGIARIVVAEDRRRRTRERSREERLRGSALLDDDEVTRIEARIEAAAGSRLLYEAMDRLGEDERGVLELVAIDELTVAEAAAATGVRQVTARVRLHRARRRLRTDLEATQIPSTENEEDPDESRSPRN
jgi:RNA polymerase sigma-70 factor, ECF subfamily